MSLPDAYSAIAKLVSAIKWDNLLSIIFGGLLTTYLSYKYLKKRERDKLKIELQVKAAEQILEEIRVVNDKSSKLFIPDFTSFQSYNSTLTFAEKNMPSSDSPLHKSAIEDLCNGELNIAKDRVQKCMKDYFGIWNDYVFSYCKFINSFETKLVILNRFIGINELLSEELKVMMDIESKIVDLFYFEISVCITNSKPIDTNLINQMKTLKNNLMEKNAEIGSIFYDFKAGLQNEFLSALFDFKIPDRKPCDEIRYPLYKAGYKHIYKDQRRDTTL